MFLKRRTDLNFIEYTVYVSLSVVVTLFVIDLQLFTLTKER